MKNVLFEEEKGGEGKGGGGALESGITVGLQAEPEVVVVLKETKDGLTSEEVNAEDAKVISERSAKAVENQVADPNAVEKPDADEAAEIAAADSEEKREAIRVRRREERARRKDEAKAREDAKDRRIAALEADLGTVKKAQTEIADRDVRTHIANLETTYESAKNQFEEARAIRRKALKEQNDEAFDAADDAMRAAERTMQNCVDRRDSIVANMERSEQQAKQVRQPDPAVAANLRIFSERNRNWFDPRGSNADSRTAIEIDEQVKKDGYDPRTAAYWEELEKRAAARMPHIKVGPQQAADDGKGKSVKQITAGAGRETAATGAETTYTLSSARVAALKEAGMWDDPKLRAKMIQRYRQIDKQGKAA